MSILGARGVQVFIDSHWFSLISVEFEAIRARKLGSLWHRVAACGSEVIPLQDDAIRQGAFCSIARLQFAGREIARYCSNGRLESAGLEGIG